MLHEALRLMRVFHDLSQKDASEKLGISKSYISELEAGKKKPTLEMLNKYAEAFDVPVSSIMFFSENLYKDIKKEKVRSFVSSKIVSMLNLIAQKSAE